MGARTEKALELWREGTERLLSGELDEAVTLFTRSLETEPTAEAYTFRGWAYSFGGRYADAIEECRKAIATDPSFGNPYNDIGCYLMEQGDPQSAIPWFERAKHAPRYEPRHFPYLNLGRLLHEAGDWDGAEIELTAATRELMATRPGWAGEGIARLADLRRRQGRLDDATALLAQVPAHPHGLLCQAELALERDDADTAAGLVARFLRRLPLDDRTERAAGLELAVQAHVRLGTVDDARAALAELEAVARLIGTPPIEGIT